MGAYRTKERRLRELQDEVRRLTAAFREVTYAHRPRTEPHISRVDRLVNAALDAADRRDSLQSTLGLFGDDADTR